LLVEIEQGEANPSLATLLKLAATLGITLTELLADKPQSAPLAVVAGRDAMTLWSTPAGSSARLLVSQAGSTATSASCERSRASEQPA
jgi:transcriptional regulator with XRE-family HTH domain